MEIRYFALVTGIVFLAIGLLGFLTPFLQVPAPDAPELVLQSGYGYLLGLFPVNVLHNLVHLLIGAWGILVYQKEVAARRYAQSLTVFYGVLAVMGLIPVLKTTFGFIPLFGHNVWLHAFIAAIAVYFGFGQNRRMEMARTT
jgi:hypothetical protein